MSRIGNKPVPIPGEVDVSFSDGSITVKGKNGELSLAYHPRMTVEHDTDAREVRVHRPNDHRAMRALHGLTRSLINNMVRGVVEPFEKRLQIVGVGYNAVLIDNRLALQVGFSNSVELDLPPGVTCELPNNTQIIVRSPDKQAVGQFAAIIRHVRPPEPYKGKGIRYENEYIRRKAGKAFGAK